MVEFVTPGTSELALAEMSVSGESVKLTPVGVPAPSQLPAEVGATSLGLGSTAYPGGAAVSVTVYDVPMVSPSKQACPLAPVVLVTPLTVKLAPASGCWPEPRLWFFAVLVTRIAPV